MFGHEKVWILDGGLSNWSASGFPVISEGSCSNRAEDAVRMVQRVYSGDEVKLCDILHLLLNLIQLHLE